MDAGTMAGTVGVHPGHRADQASRGNATTLREPPLADGTLPSSTELAYTTETRVRMANSPASSTATSRASSPVLANGPTLRRLAVPPGADSANGGIFRRKSPAPLVLRQDEPLVRRLSLAVQDYALAAAHPSTYVSFLRSLHPSLLAFFLISVSATLSNKHLLRGFFHGLTYSLTAWQMACATGGTVLAARVGAYRPYKVKQRHERIVQAVAVVFSCEILCSNLALRLVPVPFHVSLRAASPILTLLLSVIFFHDRTTLRTSSSLLMVLLGVSLTSHHEAWLSPGSVLLILSALLLTTKSLLVSQLLQERMHLAPLDILARTAPLSMLHCALFAVLNGEPRRLWTFVRSKEFTSAHLAMVALNGVLSFSGVVMGLAADKKTRPPLLSITTHAAQASTILFSLFFFSLRLSPLNFLGVGLTLAGGVLYARYDARDKEEEEGLGGEGLPVRSPAGNGDGTEGKEKGFLD
ncbi:hypothetical protein NBRC10512_001108 [Rhodotorula toruloides]|uniref:RHTO0S06e11606g1_1 n=2 Tax=Rhodotorula toruloides TaxID=5286 RepID=A0A061AXG5_RHOTO|nr:UAA transporter family protein [Rhodotorula toruloides NP11]EMS18138.1 UAA transporter family protein [Rhodotorula toruloides NP11]CDR42249.1 RHTO0S06e11606g1_1 [Rhodotorula toruloides]